MKNNKKLKQFKLKIKFKNCRNIKKKNYEVILKKL